MPSDSSRGEAPLPKVADARYSRTFDPWNSVGAGHQRAETKGPQGWRDSRNFKLRTQFEAGNSGGDRLSDTVGKNSEDFDERLQMLVPKEMRARAANSVMDMLKNPGAMRKVGSGGASFEQGSRSPEKEQIDKVMTAEASLISQRKAEDEAREERKNQPKKLFEGLVIYVNGSTHPIISDHKLKHILAENGAKMSMHLGRRQVTHVIIGKTAGASGGAGGGLAGGKLEKEIRRLGGCAVKYVNVEWYVYISLCPLPINVVSLLNVTRVIESVKAGRRLHEARFASLKVASGGQQSVFGAFSKAPQ